MIPFFSRYREKLKPQWTFSPEGLIWRLFPVENFIIGECRTIETKTTSFFCIESSTGKVIWENIDLVPNLSAQQMANKCLATIK